MNKEQIIEEIAIVLSKVNCKPEGCGYCYLEYGTLENSCEEYLVYKKMATVLYNAGYRKVDEEAQGKWHFWKLPSYSVSVTHELICSICGYSAEMLKGRHYNYCPNCGAKMKGD